MQPEPKPLGRLVREELRNAWAGEATSFTPWLARPENIVLLGEAIHLELEVESHEQPVGPFRADILCKDVLTGHFVLIENQLERTDHSHLGQLITYGAGLEAVTIVWIAARFTDEHRAALDWLNRLTGESVNFFGLEVEVWRIGDSPLAPKFNVVSQPNEWTKTVKQASGGPITLSATQQLHLDFWTGFKERLEQSKSIIAVGKPNYDHWRYFPLGRTHFKLSAANGMRDGWSTVSLVCTGPDSLANWERIRNQYSTEIESTLGHVDWEPLPDANEKRITVTRRKSPADPTQWPELMSWFQTTLEQWAKYFRPIVQSLDSSVSPAELDGLVQDR